MKTILGSLVALGLLSTAASAQYCPPGYGAGASASSHSGGYRFNAYRPTHSATPVVVEQAPEAEPAAPEAPAEVQPAEPPAEEAPPK